MSNQQGVLLWAVKYRLEDGTIRFEHALFESPEHEEVVNAIKEDGGTVIIEGSMVISYSFWELLQAVARIDEQATIEDSVNQLLALGALLH